ncbi:MAG: quinolinate synthase NadA [Bacteroidales bacterium]
MKDKKNQKLISKINQLKKEKNAVILGHFYQIPEIQDISDFIGDSLALAREAADTNADIIVFCGVQFMGESAKILSPEKKVLIPDPEAGCSLVESCPPDEFRKFREARPRHTVISYINSSVEIKALSDIICTSSNAVGIVNSLPEEENIIFAPDKNLGAYINNLTDRNMVLWNGTCEVHDILSVERVLSLKEKHPDAKLIAHPECKSQILAMADYVGSTTALLNYTRRSEDTEFLVATESGIIHQMKKYNPDKSFIIIPTDESCMCNDCPHMKLNTLEKLYNCLLTEEYEIKISDELIEKARVPLDRMLQISEKIGL